MNVMDRLSAMLDSEIGVNRSRIAEIRLRANRAAKYRLLDGGELCGPVTASGVLAKILHALMENSLYAWEEELRQGYFTASGGFRVGVCGRICLRNGAVASVGNISSVCIRVPRQKKGCADALLGLRGNLLILSPPGLGKTTLLRDLVRRLSDGGKNVAVCDERHEIAACFEGVPSLDVGSRTDVLDGCPKSIAISMLIRSCAPDVIAVDEIGGSEDARALREAARMGVSIIATAHASCLADACMGSRTACLMQEGIFDHVVILKGRPGNISEIIKLTDGVED